MLGPSVERNLIRWLEKFAIPRMFKSSFLGLIRLGVKDKLAAAPAPDPLKQHRSSFSTYGCK